MFYFSPIGDHSIMRKIWKTILNFKKTLYLQLCNIQRICIPLNFLNVYFKDIFRILHASSYIRNDLLHKIVNSSINKIFFNIKMYPYLETLRNILDIIKC